MANEPEAKFKITANADGVGTAIKQAEGSLKQGFGQIKGHFDALGGVVGKLNVAFVALGAALAGGKLFSEAVSSTVELTKESMSLGKQFGISATEASILKVALDDTFVSQDALSAAGNRITRTLLSNEKAFQDLGVKTRGANGEFRATFDILQDVNKRLLQFREGTDRNVEGQKIYGKSWAEIAPTLKLTEKAMEEARIKADALGLVVGQESVEATMKYRHAMNDVGDVMQAMKKTIGDAVMPVLTQFGEWFASIGPGAVRVLKEVIIGIVDVFLDLRLVIMEVWTIGRTLVEGLTVLFISLADTITKSMRFDFKGARASATAGMDMLREIVKRGSDDAIAEWERYKAAIAKNESRRDAKETPVAVRPPSSGEASTGAKKPIPGADDRFRELVTALEKQKEASGHFRQEDLAGDLNYWQAKLALVRGHTAQDKALREKIEHEIFNVKKQIAAQERALAEEEISQVAAIAQEEIDAKRDALHTKLELGQITAKQELIAARALEQQKYEIERQALLARQKLVEEDKLARAKIQNDLVMLKKQQDAAMTRSQQQQAIENYKYWQNIMGPISHTITSSVQGMLQGTMKLKQGLANIGQSILNQFVSMMTEQVAKYLTMEAVKTSAAVLGAETRAVAEETSAKRGLLATVAAALKTIAINAVKVISGVWAAISSIPIVGPFLAPVLALAAGAAVYGLASRISARGGYDIPAGVNPMTQLHEKEMVLPAKQADVIRKMADGEAGAGGVTHVTNFNINAIDRKGVAQFFHDHGREIAAVISRQRTLLNPAFT